MNGATLLDAARRILPCGGLFVTGVLAWTELTQTNLPCGEEGDCSKVLSSAASHVFGIPLAIFGLVAFVALLALDLPPMNNRIAGRLRFRLGYAIAGLGSLISLGLTAYSVFSLHSLCRWCFASALLFLATFAAHAWTDAQPGGQLRMQTGRITPIGTALALIACGLFAWLDGPPIPGRLNLAALGQLDFSDRAAQPGHSLGRSAASFSVIFFGDLECPTCHAVFAPCRDLVLRNGGRFVYHHAPLRIHPLAQQAALLAEEASLNGRFWAFLDDAYRTELTENRLQNLGAQYGLKPGDRRGTQAIAALKLDEGLARQLKIAQAPQLILIEGSLRQPLTFSQLRRWIERNVQQN